MDESRLKHKRLLSRKGSNPEHNIADWPYLNVSPLTLHNASKQKSQHKDSGKAASVYRIDLNNLQNISQSRESSTKRKATLTKPLEKRPSIESSVLLPSQSRNDSSVVRNKSPPSERPSLMDRVINQSLNKLSGTIKEPNDKMMMDFVAMHKQSHRKVSNPRLGVHNNYYMYRQPNSTRLENRPNSQKDLQIESARVKKVKHVFGPNESIEVSLSGLVGNKQQILLTKRENDTIKEKKHKKSLSISQVERKPSVSKMEESQLKLKDYCMYKNLNELQLGVSLGRNNSELAQKKQRLFKKLSHNQNQRLNVSQMIMSYNKCFEEQQPVQQPHHQQDQAEIYDERVGTEEYYQDFFSMHKMSFNFEKARVSQRSKSQRDYYTPEVTILYSSNPTGNQVGYRDKSTERPRGIQGGMFVKGKGFE